MSNVFAAPCLSSGVRQTATIFSAQQAHKTKTKTIYETLSRP
jgi:hypothetical protein